MLTRLRKKIRTKLQKKTSKKKINIWNIILWINIIGNIPLSLENVKNNWWRIISYFIFLLDEIFNADYRKMIFKNLETNESGSEKFKEFEENHFKKYQINIFNSMFYDFLISVISFMYTAFNLFFLNTTLNDLKISENKKMKGLNIFSLLLNNKNNEYIYLVNIAGVWCSFLGKGWIPFLSKYEPE